MSVGNRKNDSPRRCFVLASRDAMSNTLIKFLNDQGVECLRPEDLLKPGAMWSDELTRYLAEADFVVAIVSPSVPFYVGFELGLAHGMSKPALVIATDDTIVPESLRGVFVIRMGKAMQISDLVPDIDRFLRHSRRAKPIQHRPPERPAATDLTWARARLSSLREENDGRRGYDFERLIADVFERAGADVTAIDPKWTNDGDRADLVVWLDELAQEMGGPIVVECKFNLGGTGNFARNAERSVRQAEQYVQRSSAKLALLIFDHDRSHDLPAIPETPFVLAFPVDAFLD
jgi:hypothetical protein